MPGNDKIKILTILLIDKVEMKVKLKRTKSVILYKRLIHNNKFYYFRKHSIKLCKAKSEKYKKYKIIFIKT